VALHSANQNIRTESLLDRFNKDFRCVLADSPALLRQAHEIRYQVYCVENAFEDPGQHADGCESDAFDIQSAHSILTFRPTGEVMGAVRLVLPDNDAPLSFAIAQMADYFGNECPIPLAHTAEVSRFSISKKARPRKDGAVHFRSRSTASVQRAEPLMSLGLIQGLIRMSVLHKITHWCAVMEPKMLRMLASMGIHFVPVGPLLEYHGMRQLCFIEVNNLLATVRMERPSFWEVITDGGALALSS
jgi:N-acyl amino acid synthase of PEP-CTERM/exosortase system